MLGGETYSELRRKPKKAIVSAEQHMALSEDLGLISKDWISRASKSQS